MALQQINGNQISDLTDATITSLKFKNTNSVLQLPSGTTAQRPSGIAYGTLRFNTTEDKVECYVTNSDGQGTDGWTLVGAGGPHVGTKDTSYIRTNSASIDENITIGPIANGGAQFTNAMSVGPVEIASGYTLTIENGAVWYIEGDENAASSYETINVLTSANFVGARVDLASIRERVVPFVMPNSVSGVTLMADLDWSLGNIFWLTNVKENFSINLKNFPDSDIGNTGTGTNRAFGVTIVIEQGVTPYRPNGTIMINGSSAATVQWSGGGPPSINGSRRAVFGLTVARVSTINPTSGAFTTGWWAFGQITEFA
jgi:hypothetical protein